MCFFYLDFDITSHKILFEDKKLNGADQQIKFSGTPFVIYSHRSNYGTVCLDFVCLCRDVCRSIGVSVHWGVDCMHI